MQKKKILITGSLGILGRSLCLEFLKKGATVIGVDIINENLKKNLPRKYLKNYNYYKVDICNEKKIQILHKKIKKKIGLVNVIVNNAATKTNNLKNFFSDTENYPISTWRRVMDVNLLSMQIIIKEFIRDLISQKDGSIIQISSIYGLKGPDNRIYVDSKNKNLKFNTPPVYAASKAGVIGLTKYYSTIYGPSGIRCNSVAPGGIRFKHDNDFLLNYSSKVPLGRMADVLEICGPIMFLATDASKYINGQCISVDGGMSVY